MTTYLIDELEDDEKSLDKVLRDGDRLRIPMRFMDSMQRDIGQHFTTAKITDGHLNRPGFRTLADTAATDARLLDARKQADEAYAERDLWLQRAYLDAGQTGATIGQREGDICTCRGPEYPLDFGSPGHLKMLNGKLVCTPDQPRSRSAPTRPPRTDSQNIQATHRAQMNILHDQLDRELAEAWRTAR